MARNIDTIFTVDDVFANDNIGKAAPDFSMVEGWGIDYDTGGTKSPDRNVFNYLFYRLYKLAEQLTKFGGCLEWSEAIEYQQGAISVFSGKPYYARVSNINKRPDTNQTEWAEIAVPEDSSWAQSVFGRTGTIIAQSGDYSADKISYTPPDNTLSNITQSKEAIDKLLTCLSQTGQVEITNHVTVDLEANSKKNFIYSNATTTGLTFNSEMTNWPKNSVATQSSVWNTTKNTFLDNAIIGQPQVWSFCFGYELSAEMSQREIVVSFESLDNTIAYKKVVVLGFDQGETVKDVFNVEFHTTALNNTIKKTTNTGGYKLSAQSSRPIKLMLKSAMRKSEVLF